MLHTPQTLPQALAAQASIGLLISANDIMEYVGGGGLSYAGSGGAAAANCARCCANDVARHRLTAGRETRTLEDFAHSYC